MPSLTSRTEAEEAVEEAEIVRYLLRIMIINPSKKKEYKLVKANKFASKVIGLDELILSTFPGDILQPHKDKLAI